MAPYKMCFALKDQGLLHDTEPAGPSSAAAGQTASRNESAPEQTDDSVGADSIFIDSVIPGEVKDPLSPVSGGEGSADFNPDSPLDDSQLLKVITLH